MLGTIIKIKTDIREIWESRNVLKALITKNLIGRYKNSILGFGWHFVMPAIYMIVYYLVFSQIRQNPIDNFWVYLASGLFAFHFMINNLVSGAGCIVSNSGMIKKMYFPREIFVLSQVISTFVIMLIGYAIVLVALIISGYELNAALLFSIIVFALMMLFAVGYVMIVSALTVYVRDIQHFLNSISMAFFFLTPMYFTTESTTGMLNTIIWANPFTYYIEALHQIIYYGTAPDAILIAECAIISIVVASMGFALFSKLKGGFAERL